MSTLLIEGGRKLSGRITVDGNKNSALPLVAACLLSEETCRLENVPRISDIRVMADLLTGVGARVSGLGTPTIEIVDAEGHQRHAGREAGRPAARLGAADGAAARAHRARVPGAARRRLPDAADDRARTSRRSSRSARASISESGYELEAPDGLKGASFYLDEASVTGTETALLAAAAADGDDRDPPRRDRAARRRAVRVPAGDGRADRRRRHLDDPHRGRARRRKGATHRLHGDYIEAGSWAVVAAITRRRRRGPRRARASTWSRSPPCCSG